MLAIYARVTWLRLGDACDLSKFLPLHRYRAGIGIPTAGPGDAAAPDLRCAATVWGNDMAPKNVSLMCPDALNFQCLSREARFKSLKIGAGGGNRTPDIQLGKLTFYL